MVIHHTIQEDMDLLSKKILAEIDPEYQTRAKTYVDKSLRDIRYTLLYTLEGIQMKNEHIVIQYYQWLIETLMNYNIGIEPIEAMFYSIKKHCKDYLTIDEATFLDMLTFDAIKEGIEEKTQVYPFDQVYGSYVNALLMKDRILAKKVIDRAIQEGMSIKDVYLNVIQMAMYKIGSLWQNGEISVAEEHLATVITQYVITSLYPYIFKEKKKDQKVLASAIGSELHEIGIRMVADFFELEGYKTHYLGANLPIEDLVSFAKTYKPDIIALSATLPIYLTSMKEVIRRIKEDEELQNVKVLVGGQAFIGQPELYKMINADGYAENAVHAVVEGERLLHERSS